MISLAMTTATLPNRAAAKGHHHFALGAVTFRGQPIEMRDDGTALVKGVKVFRSGTFRDSWGEQQTYTDTHIQQLKLHFDLLRDGGIFPDVPWRRDHGMSIDKVMGYIEQVYVEGEFLVADYVISDPAQIEGVQTGKYRNVSAEIGMYVTNDEQAYWPVLFGVAYVDIPAVEGLHQKEDAPVSFFSRVPDPDTKETNVTTENNTPNTDEKDDKGARKPAPVSFRIGGAEETDYAKVQAHISNLETEVTTLRQFRADTVQTGRKDFVAKLADDGKIVAAQVDSMTAHALSLTDEQFEAFRAMYAAAPKLGLLAEHGHGNPNPDGVNDDPKAREILDLQEQIAMHRRAGQPDEWIAKTQAAKKLAALTAAN